MQKQRQVIPPVNPDSANGSSRNKTKAMLPLKIAGKAKNAAERNQPTFGSLRSAATNYGRGLHIWVRDIESAIGYLCPLGLQMMPL